MFQVLIPPPGAVQLASSGRTKVEIFAVGDHVLGMQCYPEFSQDVMMDIIHTIFDGFEPRYKKSLSLSKSLRRK
ncbi:unnamed protein product [Spirodela intermedia]|uniref:Uncharacterized protein n=1 Tax=Spirodela intermedia TaxID=51605 RepID=A0A7I8IWQ0_SPIIN|nr:unnamed protein product [Spirodela intermedia]CAA6662399.1 unnamed protein product [Spirodela intermedia]